MITRKAWLMLLLATPQTVYSQNSTFHDGLLSTLNDSGLSTLASVLPTSLISQLNSSVSNFTLFCPTNAAFSSFDNNTLSNATLIAQLLQYHTLQTANFTIPNTSDHIVLPTLLQQPSTQYISLNRTADNSLRILQASNNVTVTSTQRYNNILLATIPQLLSLPSNITTTIDALSLDTLARTLTTASTTFGPRLDNLTSITVFAPTDTAFQNSLEFIQTLKSSDIPVLLSNHILNGTALYSASISNSTRAISASGSAVSFLQNNTGVYVTSGTSTARILRTDILASNGVIHVIDSVLQNINSDTAAASSAAAAAMSSASMTIAMDVTSTASSSLPTDPPTSSASRLTFSAGLVAMMIAVM